uniref:Proline rich 18 n=1 Tax=Salvator merianae TaxID=96440 RepID=A0A8D0EAS4_SALMN
PCYPERPPPPLTAGAAAAALIATAKAPRKGRAVAPERSPGAFSSSWPSASLQKQVSSRSRGAQGSRTSAPPQAAAAAALGVSPSLARGRSVLPPPNSSARSCESLCTAPEGRGEAALRFSLSLPPDAIRVLQRRSLEKQQRQQQQRGRTPRSSASPGAAKRPLARGAAAGGDLHALLQVSLLNEHHRYDDVEYEEEDAPAGGPGAPVADEGLVRRCTEWLRGVEKATARDRADKLDTLPHLSTL